MAKIQIMQVMDIGPGMTIGLLKPVTSLEEIEGSAVFPPGSLLPLRMTPRLRMRFATGTLLNLHAVALEALATIYHPYCGIRGQDLHLVVTNNTTASLQVIHRCGSAPRIHLGFRQNSPTYHFAM